MSDGFHAAFAAALKTGDADALAPFLTPEAQTSEATAAQRFTVYRNNVALGAETALRAAYPAVERLIGPRLFAVLAREYRRNHPPGRPTLILYGERFADFLAGADAVSALPWLADVARHDRAWLEAHHAADAAPLSAAAAARLPAATLASLAPGLHPSARLLTSDWPAHDIWRRNRADPDDRPMRTEPGRYHSLIWRREGEVRSRAISRGEHAFLAALGAGRPLDHAAARGAAAEAGFDAPAAFSTALSDLLLKGPLP